MEIFPRPETVFFNTVFRLTGWFHQPVPPQQLGQDFRPSHSEDGGSYETGDITFARIRRKIRRKTRAVGLLLPLTPAESCVRREREATSGGRKKTHHSQSGQCCVCWTHACQRKLVLSRPKELVEILRKCCLWGGF